MPSSQNVGLPTPDEAVLQFIEGELRHAGRLAGWSVLSYLRMLNVPTAGQRAALRLALAMYGDRVDPSAHALIRQTLARPV